MIAIAGLFASLILFVFLTIKGWNVCFSVLVSIIILAVTNKISFIGSLTGDFAEGLGDFASQWWLLFVLGAVYGKILQESGISKDISDLLISYFPKQNILALLLVSALMSYGGIGTFVIAFTIYPIAVEIFRKMRISFNLLPATMLFCPTTICMTMLPGTPAVQNIIPTRYLDSSIYAAPLFGVMASVICFTFGCLYFQKQTRRNQVNAENIIVKRERKMFFSLIPCIILWIISFICIKLGIDSQYSVEFAITVGIFISLLLKQMNKKSEIIRFIDEGVKNGFQTVMITSCIMGYGMVVKSTMGFMKIVDIFLDFKKNPIFSSIIIINIIALITGSSASSLSLFFENFAGKLAGNGINDSLLHRVVCIASGGMDSMPYASGVIVANELSKTKIKDTYIHIFITCAILPLITLIIMIGIIKLIGVL